MQALRALLALRALPERVVPCAEWLHYDLGSTSNAFEVTSRNSGNIVRAGLGYKF